MAHGDQTILVTGGAGFIGSTLAETLLHRHCRVVVVDNFDDFYSRNAKERNIEGLIAHSGFSLHECSIENHDALRSVFMQYPVSAVVHIAAKAGVRPSLLNPQAYMATNVLGTCNVLECAREFLVGKFIFASSSSVYGESDACSFSETANLSKPVSPYAATKLAGEQLCYTYAALYGIQTVCLRFFTVYGPRQRPDLAINKFASLIENGQPIPVYGDGSALRDYTYIDDIVSGIVAAVEYGGTPYEIINLGGGSPVSLDVMIRTVEDALGKKAERERMPVQPGDVPRTAADISKARSLLGYAPQTGFCDGIARYIDWRRR